MTTHIPTPTHWHIDGHEWAVAFLQKSMAHHRVRHAYLITGAQNIGKSTLANRFAMALQCEHEDEALRPCYDCRSCKRILSGNHPDMLYSQSDEKSGALKIDAIREVMRLLALKPFSSRFRIAIFENFDRAQDRAQDALLKTLEEPPSHAMLILLAQSQENLMPTIISRCQHLPLRPVPTETVYAALKQRGTDDEKARLLARLSNGRIGWALAALEDDEILVQRQTMLNLLQEALQGNRAKRFAIAEELSKLDKPAVRYILDTWQTYWRDVVLQQQGQSDPCNSDYTAAIQHLARLTPPDATLLALKTTRFMLNTTLNTNANVRMALEVLMLDYPGLK
jgi:DNA polymerase-3 subunit delta'